MKSGPSTSLKIAFPMKFIVYNFYPYYKNYVCYYHLFIDINMYNENQIVITILTVDPYTKKIRF